jgi:hypothetical protein
VARDVFRVRSMLTKPFDLDTGERVIRSEWATYQKSFFLGYNARLYLTDKRLIFSPLRLPSITPAADFAPLAGRLLILTHDTIRFVGAPKPAGWFEEFGLMTRRFGRWATTWYVEVAGKRYWFRTHGKNWIDDVAGTAHVPVGEPRAIYS